MNSLLIALGGASGAVLRYWISLSVAFFLGKNFPFGTLFINVSGSFIMGFLTIFLLDNIIDSAYWRAFLLIGFLGGYTTFSSFSIETMVLFENGQYLFFFLNILLSVSLCLIAVWLGIIAARSL